MQMVKQGQENLKEFLALQKLNVALYACYADLL